MSQQIDSKTAFLTGGGATAELIARHDWSPSLGPIESWPQSLKTTVGLLLHSPVPLVLLWGDDGIMIYNDAYSVFAGGRHPRLLGSKVLEGWPEAAELNTLVMKTGMAGETLSYKDREISLNRRGTFEPCWLDLDYSPVLDESGKPGGVIAVVVETTERVLAERVAQAERERLAESEQRLQMALAAGNGIGTWDWDIKNNRVFADARFAALYGVDADRAAAGAPIEEFFGRIHPDDRSRIESRVAEVLKTGDVFDEEYRLVQPDGSVRWVVAQGQCMLSGNGTPTHFPGVSFDITKQKLADAQLRASETQFRTMAQAAPNHVWTSPPNGQLDWLNQQAYDYSGAEPGSLNGTGWVEIVHPDDVARAGARWSQALADGTQYETEFRLRRHDGQWRWHIARAVPVKDADGSVTGWVGTNTDIQDHKQAVEALRDLNADLERQVIERTLARGKVWQLNPDILGVANAEGFFENTNPRLDHGFGMVERRDREDAPA